MSSILAFLLLLLFNLAGLSTARPQGSITNGVTQTSFSTLSSIVAPIPNLAEQTPASAPSSITTAITVDTTPLPSIVIVTSQVTLTTKVGITTSVSYTITTGTKPTSTSNTSPTTTVTTNLTVIETAGLSQGAKIGIGIGGGLAFVACLAGLIWIFKTGYGRTDGMTMTQSIAGKIKAWKFNPSPTENPGIAKTIVTETPPRGQDIPMEDLQPDHIPQRPPRGPDIALEDLRRAHTPQRPRRDPTGAFMGSMDAEGPYPSHQQYDRCASLTTTAPGDDSLNSIMVPLPVAGSSRGRRTPNVGIRMPTPVEHDRSYGTYGTHDTSNPSIADIASRSPIQPAEAFSQSYEPHIYDVFAGHPESYAQTQTQLSQSQASIPNQLQRSQTEPIPHPQSSVTSSQLHERPPHSSRGRTVGRPSSPVLPDFDSQHFKLRRSKSPDTVRAESERVEELRRLEKLRRLPPGTDIWAQAELDVASTKSYMATTSAHSSRHSSGETGSEAGSSTIVDPILRRALRVREQAKEARRLREQQGFEQAPATSSNYSLRSTSGNSRKPRIPTPSHRYQDNLLEANNDPDHDEYGETRRPSPVLRGPTPYREPRSPYEEDNVYDSASRLDGSTSRLEDRPFDYFQATVIDPQRASGRRPTYSMDKAPAGWK